MSPIASAVSTSRRDSLLMLFVITSIVIVIFFDTFISIVTTWQSEAYSHGYFIIPISLILIWQKRARLSEEAISRSYSGVLVLFALSVVWWIAEIAGIQIVMQYAVIGLLPVAVLALFGSRITREIRFALLFLLFAVPFGDFFIPYLIEITASFTVNTLTLLGFPILRDGQYFQVPSGNYEVAEACAGLRYIVSTSALAVLYAHISFAGYKKAVAFVIFAILLSIVANGLRATSIVVLLHYTNLDIAAAKDHEFIGWIFYGVLIGTLLWVGNKYADARELANDGPRPQPTDGQRDAEKRSSLLPFLIAAGLATSVGPLLNLTRANLSDVGFEFNNGLPANVAGWTAEIAVDPDWKPNYFGYSQMALATYRRNESVVNVAMIRFMGQKQGAELSSVSNVVLHRDQWTLGAIHENTVVIDSGHKIALSQLGATREHQNRLVWFWHEVGGVQVSGPLQTKLLEFKSIFSTRPSISSAFIVSTMTMNKNADQGVVLARFLSDFYPEAKRCADAELKEISCGIDPPGVREN